MIPAAVMMKLATLGLSADHAQAVAEMLSSVEQSTKEEAGASLEARRSADRERKHRQRHGKSRDVTGQDGTNGTDPSLKRKVSPCTPSKEKQPTPSSEPNGSSAQPSASAKPVPRSELLVVLDAEHADQLLEHRKRMGAPLTASAAGKLAAKLAKWPDPNEAVDEMLANGWQGFEAGWMERRRGNLRVVQGQGPPRMKSVGHRLADAMGRVARGEQPFASEFDDGAVIDAVANRH